MPIITLTTDFGLTGPYVAELKAVLLAAVPGAQLIDVSHLVPPQSIRHAEVLLRSTAFIFPPGAVHLVVVDPGVGSARRPIAVAARGAFFVGPDNGVLGVALAAPGSRAVVLDRPELFRAPLSPTFHGRDLFAPVAAELAAGLPLDQVGSPIDDPRPSQLPAPRLAATAAEGETLIADDFGNLLTNLPAAAIDPGWRFTVAGESARFVRTYADGAAGELLVLAGSDGYLEVAMRDGSAAARLQATAGLALRCTAE